MQSGATQSEVAVQPVILAFAIASLVIGLVLWLKFGRPGTARTQAAVPIIWLFLAGWPVLLIFSFFPSSTIDAKVKGITATGAIAAFLVVWWWGTRANRSGVQVDEVQRESAGLRAQVQQLHTLLAGTGGASGSAPIDELKLYKYRPKGVKVREFGVVTGSVERVRFADVWVSSENTDMQMASFYDRSLSGTIRYLGAHKRNGKLVDDAISTELEQKLGDAVTMSPASVLVTGSGYLQETNRVSRIFHVAAVYGQPGVGYRQINAVGPCMYNALERFDQEVAAGLAAQSLLIPIFGGGQARADLRSTVRTCLLAAVDYLKTHPQSRVRQLYLLAYTEAELAAYQAVLAEDERFDNLGEGRVPQ
jgi:O-acetyl-ADP-ribose deacetylase (regulator of RNase III)